MIERIASCSPQCAGVIDATVQQFKPRDEGLRCLRRIVLMLSAVGCRQLVGFDHSQSTPDVASSGKLRACRRKRSHAPELKPTLSICGALSAGTVDRNATASDDSGLAHILNLPAGLVHEMV